MLRCASCGHLHIEHEHHHSKTYCSHPSGEGRYCQCVRFVHPVIAWIYDTWDGLMRWLSRWH